MLQLTKAEEQVMQILWKLQKGTVQELRDQMEEPRPARTTIATLLSILETKKFVFHTNSSRVNVYEPLISRKEYSKVQLSHVLKNYFNNSFGTMASFFAKENNLSIEELEALVKESGKEPEGNK